MSALFRWLLAAALTVCLVATAAAREEIRYFVSDVAVRTDGSVAVTETITVNAEGQDIRRGIYRDIPVVLQGLDGGKVRPGLDVVSVQRDGADEPFRTERMGNFQRLWIGDPDEFLGTGEHTYAIQYTMSRMVRPFADHDELYWNATGNFWIFPILSSVAHVTLPDGATIDNVVGYTGAPGSTEQAVSVKRTGAGAATIRTNRALSPGEGMTFAVSFPKGVVAFPTGAAAAAQWLSDLREVILPVLAALIAVAYNALAWLKVGRDPQKGTIIPLFGPPKGFSPALTHYVHRWGFQNSGWPAFTAAIFDLGVKGLVTIDNSGDDLAITATAKSPGEKLPTGEALVFAYVREKGTLRIGKETGSEIATKKAGFVSAIQSENRAVWFNNNTGYSVFGVLLAVALLFGLVWSDALDPLWLIGSVIVGILIASIGPLAGSLGQGSIVSRVVKVFWLAIVGFNLFGFGLESFTGVSVNVAAIAAVSIVALTALFAFLMRAPTLQGRKVMDEIEGLKLYLETAEKERLNMNGAPKLTVERFEKLLPYAIALGVEKPWSEHFEAELARNAVDQTGGGYSPNWYHGRSGWTAGTSAASSMSNAVSAAAASMTAAMVAAQPVSASSSGFSSGGGGGGFSGGGGGGGGGGGW